MRVALVPLVLVLAFASAQRARADAITPSEGFCPPGLDHVSEGHSDACVPRACTTDAECGSGAACHPIAECIAQQSTDSLDGRVILPTPVMVDVVVGLCRPDGSCATGQCARRRQCEPTSASEVWDAPRQRWTGSFLPSEPGHGCSTSPGRGTSAGLALTALGLLLAVVRRAQSSSSSRARPARSARRASRRARPPRVVP